MIQPVDGLIAGRQEAGRSARTVNLAGTVFRNVLYLRMRDLSLTSAATACFTSFYSVARLAARSLANLASRAFASAASRASLTCFCLGASACFAAL
jgi:hypothetical protein